MMDSSAWFILAAFAGSLVTTLGVEALCRKLYLFDNPGHRKIHKAPVPRLGGIAFFAVPLALSFFVPLHFSGFFTAGAMIVYFGGFYDDLHPANSALLKLLFQIPSACLFAFTLPLDFLHASPVVSLSVRILMAGYILFMINAANLMDNMNGLTSGFSILWLVGLAFISFHDSSSFQWGLPLLIVAASIGGFYLRNFPWGKIYMGDQGSQLLGYLNAAMTLQIVPRILSGHTEAVISASFVSILLFSVVFIVDVTTVTVIRVREKRPVWQGDQCHLSHQLVRRGFSQSKSALLLSAAQGVCVALACGSVIYFSL